VHLGLAGSGKKRHVLNRILTVGSFLLAICLPHDAHCLTTEDRVSQYGHASWLMRDGYFMGAPRAIAQTTDGYLWIGTESGLLRFDGVRFVSWDSPDGNQLPSRAVTYLLGGRDGSLWIGTDSGLARLSNQKLFVYSNYHAAVFGILEDSAGRIWTAGDNQAQRGAPLCEVSNTAVHCLGKGEGIAPDVCCSGSLASDGTGNIWGETEKYLFRWKPGTELKEFPYGQNEEGLEGVQAVLPQSDDSLLIGWIFAGARRGLQRFSNGSSKAFSFPGFDGAKIRVLSLLKDRDGGLWVGTVDRGIYHIFGNRVDHYGAEDGLSSNFALKLFEDREGGIWAVTPKGVDSFHQLPVTSLSMKEGLTEDNVVGVLASRDGTIWAANGDTLVSIRGGQITSLRAGEGLPGGEVTSLFEDREARLWVGVDNDLYLYSNRQFRKIKRKDGTSTRLIVGMTEDTQENLWAEVGGSRHELIQIRDGAVLQSFPESAVPSARSLAADLRGGIWLGLRSGNLARFREGHTEVFAFPHAFESDVRQVIATNEGAILGATGFGLIGWRNDKAQELTSANGLPCDGIIGVTVDDDGVYWLFSECGLIRIDADEISKWWGDSKAAVHSKLFDSFDGVEPGIPDYTPAVTSADGKLWFANHYALATIDPKHILRNDVKPPVHIESVIADHKEYSPTDGLRLPPLMADLEIDYTALTFVNPRKVHFRYRLDGRDSDWEDADTRRQAFYNDLPPGEYRFRVLASNSDGIWNEDGASLNFVVAPAWYQTAAFRVSCVVLAIFAISWVFQLRVRRVTKLVNARFDERLAERTRLARDLHDTFLQTLQGSKLVADDALDKRFDPDYMYGSLRKLSEWLDRAMLEGRAALQAVRVSSHDGNDLSGAFQNAIAELSPLGTELVAVVINGRNRRIYPVISHEIYRVGYEALRNALRHSQASRIEVKLTYSHDFTLQVQDNGVGMAEEMVRFGKDGHFGLQGMKERAVRIDSQFRLLDSPAGGTTAELIVPGRIAYSGKLRMWSVISNKLDTIWKTARDMFRKRQ
jgi:signal transduction histidine kinase/ligand-binding sensor domain-containing protein